MTRKSSLTKKAEITDIAAKAIVSTEAANAAKKTERLKRLRLERDAGAPGTPAMTDVIKPNTKRSTSA